nr:maleylpyruvate isomerase family mycothiol-dependent enzyme [Streptomyces murinus]
MIEDVVRSADRLAAAAAGLSEAGVRAPSGLPEWTRGQVLAHVAYSADAYTWLLKLARTGREPGPRADPARVARDAVLPAEPLAERLRASLGGFTDGARALPAPAWERLVPALAGWRHPAWYLLLRGLRELETHHLDLGVGYGTERWPHRYVRWALDDTLTTLGARRFPLTPLTGEDSATLLRALSGRPGLDAGHALVELTGGLPLALRVVAARLVARRALTPDVLAGQLAATGGRLRQLEYDDLSVRRSLAVAHDALAAADREADRDAALVLRRVGALDLPTYGAPLLARLTGIDARRAEAALDRLVDVALLEETAYGRYTPHDLVREFARELAEAEAQFGTTADPCPVDRAATCPRNDVHPDLVALRWYAAVAERALVAIVEPGLDLDDRLRPTPAQPPEHAADVAGLRSFESAGQAFAWGETELENVVALVARNADAEDPRRLAHLSVLTRLLFPYVQRSGRVAEMEVLGRAALGAAGRLDDEEARAYALGDLAGLHFLTGRHKDALALTDRCLESWRRLGVAGRIRRCLNNRGLLLEGLGRFAESEEALRQSLSYARLLNDPVGEAVTHSHLGNLYEHTDPRAAIEQHRRSLAIGETVGAVIVRHSAHCNIGYAHLTLGEPAAAARHFEQSLSILGGHGDWHGESQTRLGLVRALRELGEGERAYIECGELLRRADARADRYTGGLARHQHGLLLHAQGRHPEARTAWHTALAALTGTDEQSVLTELRQLLSE